MSKVNILHLSDLHFGTENGTTSMLRREERLNGLIQHIYYMSASNSGLKPDIVVVSGDIGWSGQYSDYEIAGSWLDSLLTRLGLQKEDLLLCPGNHDIDRGTAEFSYHIRTAEEAKKHLSIENIHYRIPPFKAFIDFCKEFGICQPMSTS